MVIPKDPLTIFVLKYPSQSPRPRVQFNPSCCGGIPLGIDDFNVVIIVGVLVLTNENELSSSNNYFFHPCGIVLVVEKVIISTQPNNS